MNILSTFNVTKALAVLILGICLPANSQQSPAPAAPFVMIADYEKLKTYRIETSGKPLLLSDAANTNALAIVLKEKDKKERLRMASSSKWQKPRAQRSYWAEPSPDGKHIVLGHEDPMCNVLCSISILDSATSTIVKELHLPAIQDVYWMPDSSVLLILEAEERYSKSPRGILFGLSGHPIPKATLWIRTLDLRSMNEQRELLARDIKYGTGVMSSTNDLKN